MFLGEGCGIWFVFFFEVRMFLKMGGGNYINGICDVFVRFYVFFGGVAT